MQKINCKESKVEKFKWHKSKELKFKWYKNEELKYCKGGLQWFFLFHS